MCQQCIQCPPGYYVTFNKLPKAGRTIAQELELRNWRKLIAAGIKPKGSKPPVPELLTEEYPF